MKRPERSTAPAAPHASEVTVWTLDGLRDVLPVAPRERYEWPTDPYGKVRMST